MEKIKCKKCGKETGKSLFETGDLCVSCQDKKKNKDLIFIGIAAFLVVLMIRFFWAEIFYKDWRCIFAECRIMK